MTFSIIVPVYNGEKYLLEALLSVEKQTFTDYEIIIVDDGSTDNSGDIADSFAEKHENVTVLHGPNNGLILARRKGLSRCNGEYVVFLDSDDAFRSDLLECIAMQIEQTGADIVSFRLSRKADFISADDSSVLKPALYDRNRYRLVKQAVCAGNFNNLCGKAIRLSCIDVQASYEPYKGIMLGEDLLQLLPVVDNATSLVRINNVLYFYRPNDDSSTGTYKRSYLLDSERVAKRLLCYGSRWDMSDDALEGALVLYINVLRLLMRYGDKKAKEAEFSLISASINSLPVDVSRGINGLRIDLKELLRATLNKQFGKAEFLVHATDAARHFIRR